MGIAPMAFLWGVLILSAVAAGISIVLRQVQRRKLQRAARELQLHFVPFDRFRLGPRIAGQLPIPAAAGVEVRDILYALRDGDLYYLFTVSFTRGLVRTRKRMYRVGAMVENRDNPQLPIRLKFCQAEGSDVSYYLSLAGEMGIHPTAEAQ